MAWAVDAACGSVAWWALCRPNALEMALMSEAEQKTYHGHSAEAQKTVVVNVDAAPLQGGPSRTDRRPKLQHGLTRSQR